MSEVAQKHLNVVSFYADIFLGSYLTVVNGLYEIYPMIY